MSRDPVGAERALPAGPSSPASAATALAGFRSMASTLVTGGSLSLSPRREASALLPRPRPQGHEPLLRRRPLRVLVFASHTCVGRALSPQ